MSEWKTVRLGDILLIQKKSKIKASDGIENGIYPFFTCSNDIVRTYNSAQYKGPALIFGTGGKASVHFCDTEFSTSTDCLTYYPVSSEINLDLVNQYIQSNIYLLENGFKGAGLKHVSRDYIANIEINLPDIKTQNCIVQKLNKAKNIISNSKKLLTKYDTLIKSRFIEMFGDPHNNTKYPYKNVGEFTTVTSGGTPDRKNNEYWKNGKIPWVKTTELQNNELTEVEEFITQKGLDESSAKMMPKGTLLIAMYGQGKTRGMTAYLGIEASTNQACACILPSKEINQRYLWYYFILSYDKLRDLAKGGNQPNLNGNMIKSFPVLMPPIDMQNKYVSFVQQIDKSKFAVQKSLEKTETLYKSLMQQYFA